MQYIVILRLTIAPEARAYRFRRKPHAEWKSRRPRGHNIGTSHRNRNPCARLGINYIVSYSDNILDIFNNIIRPSAACITHHVTRGQKWKPIVGYYILGIIILSVITTYRRQPLSPSAASLLQPAGASFRAFVDDEKRLPEIRLHNMIL